MGAYRRRRRDPDHRPRRWLLRLGRARQALPRRAQRAVLREHRPRPRRHRAGRRRPGEPSSASSRSGPTRTRRRSSWRRRSPSSRPATSTASSSRAAAPRRSSRRSSSRASTTSSSGKPNEDEGHRPRDRLPRHHAGRARGDRHHRAAPAVRAVHARRLPRAEHQRSTGSRRGYGVETLADAIEAAHRVRGARHGRRRVPRAGPERRRLLRPARGLLPARARDLRRATTCCWSPTRSSARWGRLGEWFGAQRYDYQPDMITTAKGITSAYAPLGAVIVVATASPSRSSEGDELVRPRLHVRRPPDGLRGRARQHRRLRAGGRPRATCARNEAGLRGDARVLRDIPIVGDVRGAGYFHAIELVKDQETQGSASTTTEAEQLLRGFLGPRLFTRRPDLPRRRPRRPGRPARRRR